ncbi:hypothetical protein K7X08_029643 [Anisodus acutangulus]|uniref:RING-type E3 ubiquitin transferase n=1 Tax=Anisodus acutangulus TaxID=402998 RepID=A0A9Q1QUY7_9SOLA|nr:hypothetical protein K7X08_029643 [Anisodus acutangulus]
MSGEGKEINEQALDLGRGANPGRYIVEEIWEELAKAKYMEWEHESTRHSWELQNLKELCESALKEKHVLASSQIEGLKDENSTSFSKQLEAVSEVFMKAAADYTPTEVSTRALSSYSFLPYVSKCVVLPFDTN